MSQQRATTLSLLGFALVSTAVKLNLLVPFDDAAEAWVRQQITPFRTALMFTLTPLASTRFVLVLTLLLAAVLALRKSGYWLGRLALSVPGCVMLNQVLKYLFHRTRPAVTDPLVKLQTYSFPSGHAVAATVLYGFVAILLWSYIRGSDAGSATFGAAPVTGGWPITDPVTTAPAGTCSLGLEQ